MNKQYIQVPMTSTRNRWKFDRKAIEEAIKFLGIKKSVCIYKYTPQPSSSAIGNHFFSNKRDTHIIRVSKNLWSPYSATSVLWHEFAHCIQQELFPNHDEFINAYNSYGGNVDMAENFDDYHNNPFEVEARHICDKYSLDNPLAFNCSFTNKDRFLQWLGI